MIDIFGRTKVKELEKEVERLKVSINTLIVEIEELKENKYGECGGYIPEGSPIWILARRLESLFDYLKLESYSERIDDPNDKYTHEVPQIKVFKVKKKDKK